MADVTVLQLADTVDTPVEKLLQQLQEAGLPQSSPEDLVSEDEKETLLGHIKTVSYTHLTLPTNREV